ncbi:tyrosine-type recombinase/integrase [Phenylobacterium deserti]|nr:tyrosine-type recombinase/integrase [Phenylobacterium deserti]
MAAFGVRAEAEDRWRVRLAPLQGAYAPKTVREYARDLANFDVWCAARGLAPAVPAEAETVAGYVTALFPEYVASSVARILVALRWAHRLGGHPEPTRSETVRLAYRAGLRRHGARPRQAPPADAMVRDRLLAACGDDLLGLRDRAMFWMAYDTLCRRGELMALRLEDLERLSDGGARLRVRRSKVDPEGKGAQAFLSPAGLAAVDAWLAAAGVTEGAILRRVRRSVACSGQMNGVVLNQRLRALAAAAGLQPAGSVRLSGHSFRVGAAHDLVMGGRTLLEVMRAGRWTHADTVARYVRHAPVNPWAAGQVEVVKAASDGEADDEAERHPVAR